MTVIVDLDFVTDTEEISESTVVSDIGVIVYRVEVID